MPASCTGFCHLWHAQDLAPALCCPKVAEPAFDEPNPGSSLCRKARRAVLHPTRHVLLVSLHVSLCIYGNANGTLKNQNATRSRHVCPILKHQHAAIYRDVSVVPLCFGSGRAPLPVNQSTFIDVHMDAQNWRSSKGRPLRSTHGPQ